MAPPAARAWDLVDADDALAFLAGDGLERFAGSLPFPCRVARLPRHPGLDPRELERRLPAGALLLAGEMVVVLAGPARDLRRAARDWPAGPGDALAKVLERYERAPAPVRFADGRLWDVSRKTHLLGVLNVTPDSFSDGGLFLEPGSAERRAGEMLEQGADGIDVGGESTRPGARPADPEEESRRVCAVIGRIKRRWPGSRVSIDTRRAVVARRALDAGADLVNDVSGLNDPDMTPLVAGSACPVVIMHMRGSPIDMQSDTGYEDLVGEIMTALREKLDAAVSHGIAGDRILVDPGFGFGKSASGNEEILRQLGSFRSLGQPVLVGLSRKSFIGRRTGVTLADRRRGGSVAAATVAVLAGASVVRAHDVADTLQALAMADALRRRDRADEGEPGDRWKS
ncbi:MAG: dihydropteroate synthase [Acidobacteriota bacterium]|nr:dihydropteroate synthase [Acidobacteriota bacterium]